MSLSITSNNPYQSAFAARLQRTSPSASAMNTDASPLEADTSANPDASPSSIDASGLSAFTALLTTLSQTATGGPDTQDDDAEAALQTTATAGSVDQDLTPVPVLVPLPGSVPLPGPTSSPRPTPVSGSAPLPGPTPVSGSKPFPGPTPVPGPTPLPGPPIPTGSFSGSTSPNGVSIPPGALSGAGLASTSSPSTGLTSRQPALSGKATDIDVLIQAVQTSGSSSQWIDPANFSNA